jgi:hypothetical protein
MNGFFMVLLDFNRANGRHGDTILEILLFLYRQDPNSKILLSMIQDENEAINASRFDEIVEDIRCLTTPALKIYK